MAVYYGVQRSGSTLSHYGVKGMKWGIRKAIEKAYSGRPHSLSFENARKKLERIQEQRAINKVQKAKMYGKNRKVTKLYNKASEKLDQLNKNADRNYQRGQSDQAKEDRGRSFWWSDTSSSFAPSNLFRNKTARLLMAHDNRKSKKLTSDKGHKQAVAERNAYAKQMAKMFAGTQYAKQANAAARKRVRVQR